jgi:hypothetical protein
MGAPEDSSGQQPPRDNKESLQGVKAMNTYKLIGTRVYGDENVAERFEAQINRPSPVEAMNHVRATFYNAGFNRILFTVVMVKDGRDWVRIPMMQALELE